MGMTAILVGLAAPALLIGGVTAAETASAASLNKDLISRIEATLPGTEVTSVNLRGRPYLVSRNNDLVSTAYVDLRTGNERASTELLVQNLDLDTNQAERVQVLLRFPYPSPAEPVLNPDGSFTAAAVVGGEIVTYRAHFARGAVQVFAEGGERPEPARAPELPGLELVGGSPARPSALATEDGILVTLRAEGLEMRT